MTSQKGEVKMKQTFEVDVPGMAITAALISACLLDYFRKLKYPLIPSVIEVSEIGTVTLSNSTPYPTDCANTAINYLSTGRANEAK